MSAEVVLDASVAANLFFEDGGSAQALIAPDLILTEMAHLCLKRMRRGECSREQAKAAVDGVKALLDEIAPVIELSSRAFDLAADDDLSAYDATYLALAETRDASVLTADRRLSQRATKPGVIGLVRLL